MRIEPASTIRVSGKSGAFEQFKEMHKGAEVPARIIDRLSGREAVLEIGGKRIHAEFQKGVPTGTTITLKLDEVRDNSLFFKLVDPGGREAFARHMAEVTIADMGLMQKNIAAALAKHPAGILEMNALLLGLPKQESKEEGMTRLLRLLLKLGVDKSAVSDLSLLLAGSKVEAKALQSLLVVLGFDAERLRKWTSAKQGGAEALVGSIIEGINGIDDGEAREAALRQLIGLLSDQADTPGGYVTGELPFVGNDDMHPVRYLGKDDAWIFSVDFSAIGSIEIIARKTGEDYVISVFCGNSEALDLLRQSAGELEKNIVKIRPGIHINFNNTAQAINKIVEIYSYYSLNSVFDIRV